MKIKIALRGREREGNTISFILWLAFRRPRIQQRNYNFWMGRSGRRPSQEIKMEIDQELEENERGALGFSEDCGNYAK